MENIFTCKGRQLADFLISHGSNLIKVEGLIYYFEKDSSITDNIKQWDKLNKMSMF